ncbi:hypothetical protein JTE90_022245 [Oedothorax gibbosus]|uniref:Uncharacterized protein n=1 Tax=Oedothorax gibbosus TaxID=931172 RepID=A0AAV6VWM8_9ARAC|nr:hypothetical protein JTE90_022245 [Oedothorax gibbosus]
MGIASKGERKSTTKKAQITAPSSFSFNVISGENDGQQKPDPDSPFDQKPRWAFSMAYGPIFTLRAASIRDTAANNGSGPTSVTGPAPMGQSPIHQLLSDLR